MSSPRIVVALLTPAERDLLLSAVRLLEEFDADPGLTRPLAELLEQALSAQEARRAAAGMNA